MKQLKSVMAIDAYDIRKHRHHWIYWHLLEGGMAAVARIVDISEDAVTTRRGLLRIGVPILGSRLQDKA